MNLENRIQRNVFDSNHIEQLSNFSNEIFQTYKTKELNILINDIVSLPSYEKLVLMTPNQSKGYVLMSIENFYNEIIEPSKIEYYG